MEMEWTGDKGIYLNKLSLGQISTATSAALQKIRPNVGAPPQLGEMAHLLASEPPLKASSAQ